MRCPMTSGRLSPVTIPSLADRNCTIHAMRLASTATQTSRNPYFDPAVMLEATFPGSR